MEGADRKIPIDALFVRFESRCFKTKRQLHESDRTTWTIDHILPSAYLYPLTVENAALLSCDANNAKRDKWPSDFYTNSELVELARITGANLELLASKEPVLNRELDVNACVARSLTVRERSSLQKRVKELKWLLAKYDLVRGLSSRNKKILGL